MFNCDTCKLPIGPRVSPIRVPVEERAVSFTNMVPVPESEDGGRELMPLTSYGSQIVREVNLCGPCAGVPTKAQSPVDMKPYQSMAAGLFSHVSGCKGVKSRTVNGEKVTEDCKICEKILQGWSLIPSNMLSEVLSDVPHVGKRFSFASVALENLIDRTVIESVRAKADVEVAMFYLKGYESRGGGL